MAAARKPGSTLFDALRSVRPRMVLAVDAEGKEYKINIPDSVGRNRHQHVMAALDGIDWSHVDLLDGKGGLLGRHVRSVADAEPAGELEPLARSRELSQMSGMLTIMLRAQEVALARQQQGTKELLEAALKMMDSATRRLEAAEARLTSEIDTNYQLSHELLVKQLEASMATAVDGGDDGETMASAALREILPQAMQHLLRGKAAAAGDGDKREKKPTNGATKNGAATPSSERRSPPPPTERDRGAS